MQFSAGFAFGGGTEWVELVLGLIWAAAFLAIALVVFQRRTHVRTHPGSASTAAAG
jgi:hypothetical protein